MARFMYDAAYSPNLGECRRRGAVAMSHYMTRSYAGTSPQVPSIRANGMGAVLNWEGFADELKRGSRAKGVACAHEALAAFPSGAPRNNTVKIYYSVDTDLSNLSDCDEAFRGINDAHRGTGILVGVYGEGGLIARLHRMGLVQGGQWLSMSEGFGGFFEALRTPGLVAIVQMHDAAGNWIGTDVSGTDRNTVLDTATLGAWWNDGSPYAPHPPAAAKTAAPKPAPKPATVTQEVDDMFIFYVPNGKPGSFDVWERGPGVYQRVTTAGAHSALVRAGAKAVYPPLSEHNETLVSVSSHLEK